MQDQKDTGVDITSTEFIEFYRIWKPKYEHTKLEKNFSRIKMRLDFPREGSWPLDRIVAGLKKPDGIVAYGILEGMHKSGKITDEAWDQINQAIEYLFPPKKRQKPCEPSEPKKEEGEEKEAKKVEEPEEDVSPPFSSASKEEAELALAAFRTTKGVYLTGRSAASIEARAKFREGDRVKKDGVFGILLKPVEQDTLFRKADRAVARVVKYDKAKRRPLWDKFTKTLMYGYYDEFQIL